MKNVVKLGRFWFFFVVAILCAYGATYNKDPIRLTFPPWIELITVPAYWALFASFFLGSLISMFFFITELLMKSLQIRSLRKELRGAQQQLDALRVAKDSPARDQTTYEPPVVTPR